jgi:hypothetical protein
MRNCVVWVGLLLALPAYAAERKFDFNEAGENKTPPGFRSTVTGLGKPGEWKVVMDEAPSQMQRMTPQAPAVARQAVLAQLSQDPTDEHFPLLIYEDETFDDFVLTTRFKTVSGAHEQMAGIAFRIQNETNYYVIRASSLGNTFRFYKVVNGARGSIIGPEIPIPSGVWHELGVECKGNQIRCRLDGNEVIPPLTDSSFNSGKIGFWTKSDSVSYFSDTRIVYTPREPAAQALVRTMIKKYPRLLGLKVFVADKEAKTTRLIASKNESELGQAGGKTEREVISKGQIYYGKDRNSVSVTMPFHDRNGDTIAAVRVVMTSFAGQTEQNAVIRAMPIVKEMEAQVHSLPDLAE